MVRKWQGGQKEGSCFSFFSQTWIPSHKIHFVFLDSKSASKHLRKIKATAPMAKNLMESLLETAHLSKSFACSRNNIISGEIFLGRAGWLCSFIAQVISIIQDKCCIWLTFSNLNCVSLEGCYIWKDINVLIFHYFCFSIALIFYYSIIYTIILNLD